MSEVKIGEIALLQVHGDVVKRVHRYDPAPLVRVDEASVDANGMLGWTGSGWVVDVHHTSWPEPGPRRPLSIGFTSHYAKMADRFGDVTVGAAGENIIVRTESVITLDALGQKIVIRGEGREVELLPVKVAKPCMQFTSYMLDLPEVGDFEVIKDDLHFLGDGMRGFIVSIENGADPARVHVGDEVFVVG